MIEDDRIWIVMKLLGGGLLLVMILTLAAPAWSSPPECREPHAECGHDDTGDGVVPGTVVTTEVDVNAEGGDGGNASIRDISSSSQSSGTGGESSASINYARQIPNIYLGSPGSQFRCGLIIGFSASTKEGGAAIGIPWPRGWAPTCDIWKAAEEAQQNGHIFTSYALQCTIKHIAKRHGKEKCDAFNERSLIELGIKKAPVADTVTIPKAKYTLIMMAQVQQEELDEAQEEIKTIRKELATVTERLKKPSPTPVQRAPDPELAAMKAREAEREEEAAKARAYFKAKYDASIARAEERTDEVPEDD